MWFVYALSARVLHVLCRAAHGCCEASYSLTFSLSSYEQEQGWKLPRGPRLTALFHLLHI